MVTSQVRHPLYYPTPYYARSPLGLRVPVLFPLALAPMAASPSYVLLQKGEDPFHTRFEDLDGLTAFSV
jgi:hypothetical protein